MSGPGPSSDSEPTHEGVRDARLVQRAVAGDQVALTTLLAECRGRIVRYIRARVPDRTGAVVDAEDIVQSALIEVFRHIGTFSDRGPGSFQRWVATIAVRKLRDAVRLQRTARRGGGRPPASAAGASDASMIALLDLLADPGHTPSQSVALGEAVRAVREALEGLPEDYRRAVWLVNIEGRSVAEAAGQMGRTERAIHNLCHKGRELLREAIGSRSRFLSSSG